MWKPLKKDNIRVSLFLLAFGVLLAFFTIVIRLSSCLEVPPPQMRYSTKAHIDVISYITLKRSAAQVKLDPPYLPKFSEKYAEQPQVIVNWRLETRSGESYSGRSIGVLAPPYNTFIFSVQDDLETALKKYHSEQIFVNEYRYRILRDVTYLHVELVHPETGNIEARFTQKYDPDLRQPETPGIY
jgi:hypothetical protein